ncbi:RMD1 family protein [Candidatus Uhrbacteria bacterium]|nr:RMD1 family protein [Candidatus Uhrbacteria bacterium]
MERLPISAHYIKASLNLAKIEQKNGDLPLIKKERTVLVYKPAENQLIFVFAFGVVTLFGISDKKEVAKFLKRFGKGGEEELAIKVIDVAPEDYVVVVDPEQPEAVEFDYVRVKNLSHDKIMIVAHMLAQSVAIDFFDRRAEEMSERFERIHMNLAKKGRVVMTRREIMQTIGTSGGIIIFIIGQLALLDKPDITWEEKEAETLFVGLRKMYELDDRFSSLRFKITQMQDTSELMLDVLNTRRAEFMEVVIILLFVLDIFLLFFER